MFYGTFWGVWWFIRGFLILGRGVPSSAGRRGASQSTPNAPAGRRGGRPSDHARTAPGGRNEGFHMRSPLAKKKSAYFDVFAKNMRLRS